MSKIEQAAQQFQEQSAREIFRVVIVEDDVILPGQRSQWRKETASTTPRDA